MKHTEYGWGESNQQPSKQEPEIVFDNTSDDTIRLQQNMANLHDVAVERLAELRNMANEAHERLDRAHRRLRIIGYLVMTCGLFASLIGIAGIILRGCK